jgi:hypothetical protein
MNAGIQLSEAEKNRAQQLEMQKRDFENSKATIELQNKGALAVANARPAAGAINPNDRLNLF